MPVDYTHELKTWPKYFNEIWDGWKRFEVRSNLDRTFEPEEYVHLKEWEPEGENTGYTGRVLRTRITYVLDGKDCPFLPDDTVVFGFVILGREENEPSTTN